jgi:hypothetical protein
MEFLTSADGRHLYGRGEKIKELLGRIDANRVILLLGNSGSGKTSLIHAGLFPAAIGAGWFPVYTRPLGLPRGDVVTALLASVFEGPHSYRGALLSPLEQAAAAVVPQRLLLIIDQFEDILTARDEEEAERLVRDLQTIYCLDDRRIRVLVSYRADLEARLGRFWQLISGSPEGLARVYVAGISASEAWKSVESACRDLRIKLDLSETEKAQMGRDLQSFSASHGEQGVYPPYIQMFIDHIWRKTGSKPGTYRFDDYLTSGAMEGVTAGYLTRQLAYAHDAKGQLKSALVSLVRSYGVKAQKSLAEVAVDMGIAEKECEVVLERLIDLRLVRHVADLYEVAHDFLARDISEKLVDSEEKEFKRVRELVASKSATYATTRSLLTVEESLMLFKYEERVLPSDGELRLILASWVEEQGPGLYLLLGSPSSRLLELIRDEESKRDIGDEERAMLALLRRKVSGSPLGRRDWPLFRRYRLGMELAGIISTAPLECPDQVLSWALRNRRKTLRDAAFEAVAKKVANGHRKWIAVLSKSSSPSYRSVYEQLTIREDLPLFSTDSARTRHRMLREFGLVQRIARVQVGPVLRTSLNELKTFRPRARIWMFAKGIATHRTVGLAGTLMRLPRLGSSRVATLMNSASGNLSESDYMALLDAYLKWNQKEARITGDVNVRLSRVYEDKATALAMTILRVSTKRNLKALRILLEKIALTPSAQYCELALVRLGSLTDTVKTIKKVEQVGYEVRYWFQIEMGHIIEKRMEEIGGPVPNELVRICRRKGFWDGDLSLRSKVAAKDKLPLKCTGNRALYLRMVAHAIIGAARQDNLDLLERLAQHNYRMIAKAAAARLAQLGGDAGMKMLQSGVTAAIERGNAEAFGLAVRNAEIKQFGLIEI